MKYTVYLYAGVGLCVKDIEVEANHEDEALEAALIYCEKNNLHGLYYELDEIDPELTDDEINEEYIYIDPGCYDPTGWPAYFAADCVAIRKTA